MPRLLHHSPGRLPLVVPKRRRDTSVLPQMRRRVVVIGQAVAATQASQAPGLFMLAWGLGASVRPVGCHQLPRLRRQVRAPGASLIGETAAASALDMAAATGRHGRADQTSARDCDHARDRRPGGDCHRADLDLGERSLVLSEPACRAHSAICLSASLRQQRCGLGARGAGCSTWRSGTTAGGSSATAGSAPQPHSPYTRIPARAGDPHGPGLLCARSVLLRVEQLRHGHDAVGRVAGVSDAGQSECVLQAE
jgi:hypothetical protein